MVCLVLRAPAGLAVMAAAVAEAQARAKAATGAPVPTEALGLPELPGYPVTGLRVLPAEMAVPPATGVTPELAAPETVRRATVVPVAPVVRVARVAQVQSRHSMAVMEQSAVTAVPAGWAATMASEVVSVVMAVPVVSAVPALKGIAASSSTVVQGEMVPLAGRAGRVVQPAAEAAMAVREAPAEREATAPPGRKEAPVAKGVTEGTQGTEVTAVPVELRVLEGAWAASEVLAATVARLGTVRWVSKAAGLAALLAMAVREAWAA